MWISSTGSTRRYVFAYLVSLLLRSTAAAQADRDPEHAQMQETSAQLSHRMWQDSLPPTDPRILEILFSDHEGVTKTNHRWPPYNPPKGVLDYLWGQPRSAFNTILQTTPFTIQVLPDSDGGGLWLLAEYLTWGTSAVSFMFCDRAHSQQPLQTALKPMKFCGLRLLFRPENEDEQHALGHKANRYDRLLDGLLPLFGGWDAPSSSLHNSPNKITAAKLRWCGTDGFDRIPSCRVNLVVEVNPDDGFAMLLFATPLLYRHANVLHQYAVKDNPLSRLLYGQKYVEPGCDGLVECSYWYKLALSTEDATADVLAVSLRRQRDLAKGWN